MLRKSDGKVLFFILSLPFINEPLALNLSTILEAIPAAFFGDIDIILAVITSDDLAEFAAESVTLFDQLFNPIVHRRVWTADLLEQLCLCHCGEVVHIRPSLQ